MQISTAIIVITTSLVFAANAQVLRLPITRQSRPDPIISSIQKRNAALVKRDPFLASLYNDQGSQYLIEISVGTPPQNFSVTLDTGSADLWIPGSACPTTECPNGVFKESESSTFKNLNSKFTLAYGIGDVNGTYVTDTVSVGGGTVPHQQFGLASDTQQILTNPNTITITQNIANKITNLAKSDTPTANGILGLGYPKLTASSSKGLGVYNPFVFSLAAQNIIADPIFSIYLNSAAATGWSGEIIFGGVDHTKYTGNLTYMPVVSLTAAKKNNNKRALDNINNSNYYWMVNAQGVSIQDGSNTAANLDLKFASTGAFILDTGTTLTYLPTALAQQLVAAAAGSNGYQMDAGSGTYLVDCDAASETASFVMNMAASNDPNAEPITLSIPLSQLFIPLDSTSRSTSTKCLFGIAPSDSVGLGKNMYLVGDSVLRSAYMVFDMANDRIGIAAAAGASGSAVDGVSAPLSAGVVNSPTMFALAGCIVMAVLTF
ncbi:aspartic peptidase domain-containing protein [Helicostylum pulchrum]|nr:aspartic peptidase domain-containing protein [Helicostylum pulchrum]